MKSYIIYKCVKTSLKKRTISVSGGVSEPYTEWCASGFVLLQMVLESDIGRCVSEDAKPLKDVNCEIPHRLKRGLKRGNEAFLIKIHVFELTKHERRPRATSVQCDSRDLSVFLKVEEAAKSRTK